MEEFSGVKKAVIPVAGMGTRMLPATKAIPKELLPIGLKPIIQHVVEEALEAGIEEFIFITRSGKEAIENHFDRNFELEKKIQSSSNKNFLSSIKDIIPKNIKISSVRQPINLGLGDAILCAEHLIKDEDFAVLLPDEFLLKKQKDCDLKKMIKNYFVTRKYQILTEKVRNSEVSNFGVLRFHEPKKTFPKDIKSLFEKPKKSLDSESFRIIGRYILPKDIFSFIKETSFDKNNEIQLTNSINLFLKKKKLSFEGFLSSSEVYDCGSEKGFIGANIAFNSRDKKLKKYMEKILLN